MQEIKDFDKVEEKKNFEPLKAGPYVCKIIQAVDVPDKEYIRVEFDIIHGDSKGYFQAIYDASKANEGGKEPKWRGMLIRSYKTSALPFFKAFITAVEKSNQGYKWNWDEKTLKDKIVAVNFREEEYVNMQGERACIVKPFEFRSIEAFKAGKVEVAPLYTLEKQHIPAPESEKTVVSKEVEDQLPF